MPILNEIYQYTIGTADRIYLTFNIWPGKMNLKLQNDLDYNYCFDTGPWIRLLQHKIHPDRD